MPKSRVVALLLALCACAVTAPAAMAAEERGTPAKVTVLKKGSRGKLVRALQERLGITADGVFGRQTRRAVKRFQRRKGLVADGIAGPATLAALGLKGLAHDAPKGRISRVLERLAVCESGGDPTAVSANGRYRGKYQFSRATWRAMGGEGDPAKAPEAEQDRRARKLYKAQGLKPWPACGRKIRRG